MPRCCTSHVLVDREPHCRFQKMQTGPYMFNNSIGQKQPACVGGRTNTTQVVVVVVLVVVVVEGIVVVVVIVKVE